MNIGDRIKQKRTENKMTLEELGKKADVNKATIHRYESGKITNIPSDRIERISEALSVSPSYLMGWEDNSNLNKIIETEFEIPYTQANELLKIHLNGVLRWITDKLQSPKDTILLTKHFNETLYEYKKLIERYLQANLFWNHNSNIIIKDYKEKYPDINEDEIISKYFEDELSLEIDKVCDRVKSISAWRRFYYDDL